MREQLRTKTDEKFASDLARRIRTERRRRELSQSELGKALDKSQGYISKLEQGALVPSFLEILHLATHFEKPLHWFYNGKLGPSENRGPEVAELAAYGINDLISVNLALPVGAFRDIEDVICRSLASNSIPRIQSALPVLVLKNNIRSNVLLGYAMHRHVVSDVALICEIANHFYQKANWLRPDLIDYNEFEIENFLRLAWAQKSRQETTISKNSNGHPFWKRWKATLKITLQEFEERCAELFGSEQR